MLTLTYLMENNK